MNGKEIHQLYNDKKENMAQEKLLENLKTYDFKVVFNILGIHFTQVGNT